MESNRFEETTKVTIISILWNIVLTIIKVLGGILGKSNAMIADGLHSASDIISSIGVLIGNHIAKTPNDKEHNYGHEKAETLVSFLLSILLIFVSLKISLGGINSLFHLNEVKIPTILPLVISLISIGIKEYQYRNTIKVAKMTNSPALKADAWHHRSDALSSVGSFIGILGARIKFPILDPIASIIICLLIIKVAYDIFKDSIYKLIDASCDDETINKIKDVILEQEGVIQLDSLKTRVFGSRIYADIEISAYGKQSLEDAHDIAERIHDEVEKKIPMIKHCMVHVNPYKDNKSIDI